ncbi:MULTISPECIES: polyprenyl synthetase family protein [Dietzia]|jgi:heptaprenyl diphosphate synthase|uniref:Polyprenyl synthetase family protein n=1 Tax=Dietzia maris TaxID=37915 RepID=A0AAE4QXT6_9ACTN|nr:MULTISPECIES: polyprenyl synthetase family protein [Dietzia]MBB0990154.1 polyprenyl synthetase family protein [Dietzia sp. SLG510A3-30A2]ODQ86700.1 geranylgeranyl pyrophosphate synthase [Dietzia alimentaria]HBD22135.1 polyprenyl synthetase family protein [Dietzia sp.]MBB0998463.1 polyprenyl synthetase family protein [Dietzia maris]MCT1434517.1 polyprenyl synthetase family protein [Dietzia maris]
MSSDSVTGTAETATDHTVAGVDVGDADLAADLRERLDEVEKLLVSRLQTGEDFLSEVALHLVTAGGKRFRPVVTLLSGSLGPAPDRERLVKAAVVCEMIHLATLYHDDVMDEAAMRRGVESANSRWDNSTAILAGDFLFAHSSMLLADLGPEAVQLIAQTFAELVTGQMRETVGPGVGSRDEGAAEHYLRVIWEKTGSLIAAAAQFGGEYSGATAEQIGSLRRLGDAVGIAFQIADDIIDIASPSTESGKTPGTDLREGVHTLPMIYAMEAGSSDSARLRDLLAEPLTDDAEVAEALELLRASDGMRRARATLEKYVDDAMTELDVLPAGPANEALRRLVRFTVDRVG